MRKHDKLSEIMYNAVGGISPSRSNFQLHRRCTVKIDGCLDFLLGRNGGDVKSLPEKNFWREDDTYHCFDSWCMHCYRCCCRCNIACALYTRQKEKVSRLLAQIWLTWVWDFVISFSWLYLWWQPSWVSTFLLYHIF